MKTGIVGVAAMMMLAAVASAAAPDEKAAKPLIACDKIVETYKLNKSVDETSDTLMVDQSRVAECLKAAGITNPSEDDQ
jgi:hypothetical protein